MLSQYLLCALCAVSGVFSRAVPDVAQVPLLHPQQQNHAKPEHMGVMIAFKRSGEDHEKTFQCPLRQPLRGTQCPEALLRCLISGAGSMLHSWPGSDAHKAVHSMKIVAVLDVETATLGSLEELARIRCRIQPEFSAEEVSAASASGVELGVWPTFGVEDGVVVLDRSDSRWFLAGRLIKSIECC
ncbi:hypothetical protein BU25DRAFT_260103 [Macroventuria anomochaeta]|uniref:Uncharacterized protein n=1 Tax=Macroventuria anomochaeta TaxID=301207 RepID=A0ACB6S6P6_9PLEO|nr:uncharacterized protein BU25DRAFT_260103 [Macroventuria anomochaeta]KAF2629866.1 hypothetical protein BU25DRAFT_260103 [Macroventuria anomochaeta]